MDADTFPSPAPASTPASSGALSPLDRALRFFGDVRGGEARDCLLLFANIFLLLTAYYVIKTVREPLILATGGAEVKSYAAAVQAAVLLVYVPAYGWLAGRLSPRQLVIAVIIFFSVCLQIFFFAGLAGVKYVGFVFYVWVGIFSLTCIAQFWSFANDTYDKPTGDRLFPIIAIGATAGAPIGAKIAERLFASGASAWTVMQVAAAILIGHLALYLTVRRHQGGSKRVTEAAAAGGGNGFALVFNSRYLLLIAALLVLLNVVNTNGEYILSKLVTARANALGAASPSFNTGAYIGQFYGDYFFWVNIVSVVAQALLVSRFARWGGIAAVLFALPVVAMGAYGLVVTSASIVLVRWVKTGENAADYSFMNTAKQMLWLPTTREQKYKGKQAIDTFFVRFGDMLSAAVVFVGTQWLILAVRSFALINLVLVLLAMMVVVALVRENRKLGAASPPVVRT